MATVGSPRQPTERTEGGMKAAIWLQVSTTD